MEDFLEKLRSDYPELIFRLGAKFSFLPPKTVILGPPQENYALLTLHELSHAILKHKDYTRLIQLLKIEAEAWGMAQQLALKYNIPFDEEFSQAKLDTYRNHLHKKSLCPSCRQPRPQKQNGQFHCPLCDQ
jgi:hypothetical protein